MIKLFIKRVYDSILFWPFLYLVCILVSACLYSGFLEKSFAPEIKGFGDAVYFSIVTITTLGYGEITPTDGYAKTLVSLQALIGIGIMGMFLNTIASNLISRESKNKSKSARLLFNAATWSLLSNFGKPPNKRKSFSDATDDAFSWRNPLNFDYSEYELFELLKKLSSIESNYDFNAFRGNAMRYKCLLERADESSQNFISAWNLAASSGAVNTKRYAQVFDSAKKLANSYRYITEKSKGQDKVAFLDLDYAMIDGHVQNIAKALIDINEGYWK